MKKNIDIEALNKMLKPTFIEYALPLIGALDYINRVTDKVEELELKRELNLLIDLKYLPKIGVISAIELFALHGILEHIPKKTLECFQYLHALPY